MKYLLIITLLASCATTQSPYQPAKNKKSEGYWHETASEKGAYRVFAVLNHEMPKNIKFRYLSLRLGELCEAKGMPYFDPSALRPLKELRIDLPAELEEVSIFGLCYKENFRRELGVEFDLDLESLVVVKSPANAELHVGDIILSAGNHDTKRIEDIRLAIFNLPENENKIELKIIRDGKKIPLQASVQKNYEGVFNLQDLYFLKRDLQ